MSQPVAEAILSHVAKQYFEHYAIVVHMHDTEVVRGEKYI